MYDQKQSRLRHIGAIKELMAAKAPEITRSFLLETLRQAQQQLEELNQAAAARPKPVKPSGLRAAMNKLRDRTIEKFMLVVDEADGSYLNRIDISELPSAYKDAAEVKRQIADFNLATVVDEIRPYGCIMAKAAAPLAAEADS